MADNVNFPDQAEIFNLPVLPEVMLLCSMALEAHGFDDVLLRASTSKLNDIITLDPALMLKYLSQQECGKKNKNFGNAVSISKEAEPAFNVIWAHSVISSASYLNNDSCYDFLRMHWHSSVQAALMMKLLAEKLGYEKADFAQLSGLLMYAGKLLFFSRDAEFYLTKFSGIDTSEQALSLETGLFGETHNSLLVKLLKKLGLPDIFTAAITYQHEKAPALSRAPLLSRMHWATSQLTGLPNPSSSEVSGAAALLELEINELMLIREQADQQASQLAARWQISVDNPEEGVNNNRKSKKAVRNRFLALALSALLKDSAAQAASDSELSSGSLNNFIEQGLNLLMGSSFYLLLTYEPGSEQLTLLKSNLEKELVSGLQIVCDPDNRDGFAAVKSFLQGEPVIFPEEGLATVLDKQILNAMGTRYLHVYPLYTGEKQVGTLMCGSNSRADRIEDFNDTLLNGLLSGIATNMPGTEKSHINSPDSKDQTIVGSMEGYLDKLTFRQMVHEINNPLTIIKNYLQLLALKLEDQIEIREDLKVIDSEISRVSSILGVYREGKNKGKAGVLALNKQVEKITRVIAASLDENSRIRITTELDHELTEIRGDEDKIRQILTNLVKNSVEAMPEGGEVRVITSLEVNMEGKEFQKLTISDTGPGLTPQIRKNLFKQGFSTKGKGHSGSGLAITRDLVEEMGGTISCQSSRKGTSFSLLLPVTVDPRND